MSDLRRRRVLQHAYHQHPGSFLRRTPLLQTKLSFGKEVKLCLAYPLADSFVLGSMVALAAAPSVASLPKMVPSRGKPAHLHLPRTPTRG